MKLPCYLQDSPLAEAKMSGNAPVERFYSRKHSGTAAFTMVEIALSLAVIGFALVAIIGVLPLGMNVQRENREETIINQDATLLMEAIRNGAQGMDDLTNYVLTIKVDSTTYGAAKQVTGSSTVFGYTAISGYTSTNPAVDIPLTNGFWIVGLLSTPKYIHLANGSFRSNFVATHVRAMSGAANEKAPQDNPISRDMGLTYRVVSEITTYGSPVSGSVTNNAWDANWVSFGDEARTNYAQYARGLSSLHDIRLLFRWPVLPGGKIPNTGGRQVYRTSASGTIVRTSEPQQNPVPLYFIQPRTYTTNSL